MMRADHMILAAGTISFTANFRDARGFPDNGISTIAATGFLAFILATTRGTDLERVSRAFAGLVLLVAIFYYVPGFYEKATGKNRPKRKRKNNG